MPQRLDHRGPAAQQVAFEGSDSSLKVEEADAGMAPGELFVNGAHLHKKCLKCFAIFRCHLEISRCRPLQQPPCRQASAPDRRIKSGALQISAFSTGMRLIRSSARTRRAWLGCLTWIRRVLLGLLSYAVQHDRPA